MNTPFYVVVNAVINFALVALFLRFLLEFAQIERQNPYVQAARRMTGVIDVFSRILPNLGANKQVSTAAIALMLLLYWVNLAANAFILQVPMDAITLFFVGTLQAIIKFLAVLRYVIIGSVLASWLVILFSVSHPMVGLVMQLSEPIVAPFRRIMPNLGMLDLSPILALLGLSLAEKFITIIGANILDKM